MSRSSTSHPDFTAQHRRVGQVAAWGVSALVLAYAVTTGLGFRSLASPRDPIGDPYFTVMELLILAIAPLLVVTMVAVHAYARPEAKLYSFTALLFTTVLAVITSCVHLVVLTVSRPLAATGEPWVPLVFSFTWPSVVYALDILAWDWFFALAVLFAAPVFGGGRLQRAVQALLVVSGVLSLVGLLGIPLADMGVRNVGVVGYAVVAPVAFLLVGVVFRRTRPASDNVARRHESRSAGRSHGRV
jgi:hypothetical protein